MEEYHLNLQTAEGVGFPSFEALPLMFQPSKNCAHKFFHHIFILTTPTEIHLMHTEEPM